MSEILGGILGCESSSQILVRGLLFGAFKPASAIEDYPELAKK